MTFTDLVQLSFNVLEPLAEVLDVRLEAFHLQTSPPLQVLVPSVHQLQTLGHLYTSVLQNKRESQDDNDEKYSCR